MKIRTALSPVLVLGIILLSGCATRYSVRVDALSSPDSRTGATMQSYALASDLSEVQESDLFFKELSSYIQPLLSEKNLRTSEEGETPDLRIGVKAHLSDPLTETRSYSDPVYLESRGYSRTVRIPVVNSEGKVVRYAYRNYWTPPRTHFAGYVDRDEQVTVYDKILVLSARPITAGGKLGDELWNIKVSLRSQSTDYRKALPYMLLAAKPYIGKRTRGEEVIVIREDDPGLLKYQTRTADGR